MEELENRVVKKNWRHRKAENAKNREIVARIEAAAREGRSITLGAEDKPKQTDCLVYLQSVIDDPLATTTEKIKAASELAKYQKVKTHDGGIKEAREKMAKQAALGQFAPGAPPTLVVNNR